MRLSALRISNFRGLSEVEFTMPARASVIVGPNAIGKTSILEAIRIAKCLLMPSYAGEEQQVLQSLGIVSPHTQLFDFGAVLGDVTRPLEIRLSFTLLEAEVETIRSRLPLLVGLHIRNLRGITGVQDQVALIQFLSSPEGKEFQKLVTSEFEERFKTLATSRELTPTLVIDPKAQQISGKDLMDQEMVGILGRAQSAGDAFMSYFPADRAMPAGEVNIQIGGADTQQQLQSHMGAPATKYHRLKQYLVNQHVRSDAARLELLEDFNLVFDRLLPGKRLESLSISPIGLLSVRIREDGKNSSYDIDGMSSGEKGLLLTFLLLRRACIPGGIVLLDEPELHLNPTVTKKVLGFLVDEVLTPSDLQAILCTHSPEILAAAYEREDCTLLHLRSGRDVSPIHKRDKSEVYEALKRLGAQTSDVLFLRGCVFVEGKHDAELLEHGFGHQTAGYKVATLGGRQEVEKEIRSLQAPGREKEITTPQCFIFDRDHADSALRTQGMIRVAQWERTCFENYLLDSDVIYDVLKELPCKQRPESRSALLTQMRELARRQLKAHVVREVYKKCNVDNPGLRPAEVDSSDDFFVIAETLLMRLKLIQNQVGGLSANWAEEFAEGCRQRECELADEWRDKWETVSDGKKILEELHRSCEMRISVLDFKRKIVAAMASAKTASWRLVDSILSEVIAR